MSTPDPYAPPPGGPPPYGYPPTYGPAYGVHPPRKPTDGVSIASLATGLCLGLLWPVALVLAFFGFRRTRPESPLRGRGFAVAGLVLGVLGFLGTASVTLAVLVFVNSSTGHNAIAVLKGDRALVGELARGDCFKAPSSTTYGLFSSVPSQECSGRHDAQVIEESEEPDADYPGTETLIENGQFECRQAFLQIIDTHPDERNLRVTILVPSRHAWDSSHREVICTVRDARGPRTGSLLSTVDSTNGLTT